MTSKVPEMPLLSISSPATIQTCANFQLRPSDIFICSYPKSGTTWTQHIVISLLLLHRQKQGDNFHANLTDSYSHVSDFAPFFEIDPHWNEQGLIPDIVKRHEQLGRRVFNTHLRGDMLPKPIELGKFIYITRSPLDACVSFYHHLTHQVEGGYHNSSLDDFFNEWIHGKLPFGSWMDHFYSYSNLVARNQVLHLSYEEMVMDLPTCVENIIAFLEMDDLLTKEDVTDIIPSFEFDHMKNHLHKFQPKSVTWKNDFRFLRRGCIGDYKNHLTHDQVLLFKNELRNRRLRQELSIIFGDDVCSFEKFILCLK